MLGNIAMCDNFWILEEEKHRQLRIFVILGKKVKETGILIDKAKREKSKTMRTSRNIAAVVGSVREAPSTSIHLRSQQLDSSKTSLRQILHKDLSMTLRKVQLVRE